MKCEGETMGGLVHVSGEDVGYRKGGERGVEGKRIMRSNLRRNFYTAAPSKPESNFVCVDDDDDIDIDVEVRLFSSSGSKETERDPTRDRESRKRAASGTDTSPQAVVPSNDIVVLRQLPTSVPHGLGYVFIPTHLDCDDPDPLSASAVSFRNKISEAPRGFDSPISFPIKVLRLERYPTHPTTPQNTSP